jgi:hypothetical protein
MPLSFPNLSRSYDADRRRIRFWGHDNAMEVSFFLEEGALFRLKPTTRNEESAILAAFDAFREKINAAADKAHSATRRSFYVLVAADF